MNAQSIISSFATLNENNEVVSFNFADFDILVSELVTERAKIRKDNKEAIKAEKEAANEVLARKIETKSKSGNSAACEVISGIECAKSNKRYPKFHQVIVPVPTEE